MSDKHWLNTGVGQMNERRELEALVGVEAAQRIEGVLGLVKQELIFAMEHFQPFNSPHEGYAIILEELDELWDEIKRKDGSAPNMHGEALQVAAMGLRFIVDLERREIESGEREILKHSLKGS